MPTETLLLFVPACFALNMAPGPNNLLALGNATRYGVQAALLGGVGRLMAFVVMIALAATGLAVVLQTSEIVFSAVKYLGAAYLLYLAVQIWRMPGLAVDKVSAKARNAMALVRQEFIVAAGNPKAILIFTAFLPQFVDPILPAGKQFIVLGILFLMLETVAIAIYACLGFHAQRVIHHQRSIRLFNRISGSLLAIASLGLLFSRRAQIPV